MQRIQQRLREDFAAIQALSPDPRLIRPDLPPQKFGGSKGKTRLLEKLKDVLFAKLNVGIKKNNSIEIQPGLKLGSSEGQ